MKNIIKTLLVVMTLVLVLVAFTGCDKLNETKCEIFGHNIVLYGEDLPTCTETGLSAGAICNVCGYVERNRFEIPATGHSFAPATCTVAKTCSVCGATEGEALGHTPVEVAQKDATCTEDGLAAHTACSVCKEIIGEKPATIPATGHTLSDVEGKAATCTEDGYTAHKACACGYTEGKETIPAAHSLVDAQGKAATCTEDGYTAHKTCENCDYTEGKETVPASHSIVDVEAKAATCTADGYNAHKACENCDYTEGKEVIDSLGHADENGDFKCDRCSTKMLPADGEALTIPQALAIAKLAGTSYTTQKYYITGTIKNVYNTQYGNMYIQDEDGNELCIYGLYTWDKAVRYDAMTYKPVAGDEVTVYTVLGMYNSTCQGKDAWLDEVVHNHIYSDATCTEKPTCSCGETNGEALGHNYVDGVCENCNGIDPDYAGEVAAPTYVKVTDSSEITTGTYVLVVNGYVMTNYDSTGWVLVEKFTGSGDTIVSDSVATWTLTVSGSNVTLKDSKGTFIKPKSGNNNGIQTGSYNWVWSFANGSVQFKGSGSDTTTLAANVQSSNKIRAYKNATVSGNTSGYPANFTLYKLVED